MGRQSENDHNHTKIRTFKFNQLKTNRSKYSFQMGFRTIPYITMDGSRYKLLQLVPGRKLVNMI